MLNSTRILVIYDFDLFVRISLFVKQISHQVLVVGEFTAITRAKRSEQFIKEKELWIKKYKNHKLFKKYIKKSKS